MTRLRWYDHIAINIYWFAQSMDSATMTPIVLPLLVMGFVPAELKNTFYGILRAAGLIVAIIVQPAAGLLSDRSTLRWGRRRPFIIIGTVLCIACMTLIGLANSYLMLLAVVLLLQVATNISHGALQGLIPDRVPEDQRGVASGVKSVFDLLPIIVVAFTVAKLADAGQIWACLLIVMASRLLGMLITVLGVKEEPLAEKPEEPVGPMMWRILGMLLGIVIGAVAAGVAGGAIGGLGGLVAWPLVGKEVAMLIGVGIGGLVAIVVAIVVGVWASVSISADARRYPSFTWWVVNRLLFLAGVGSLQSFALYFLQDVLRLENAAGATGKLMMFVGLFTVVTALPGGYLSDKFGRKRLLVLSGIVAGLGTGLLFVSTNMTLVTISGCIIGAAVGIFMATNWALGTDLVPPEEAGRYLGISNLASAGAGVVGAGLGGPLADYFNRYSQGLGYMVIFGIFAICLLLSSVVLVKVAEPHSGEATQRA
ncbi:MAG: MFS transporter [Anaerolineae bacterium]|nr:MFS transporter [Anaerolineae bacterium]